MLKVEPQREPGLLSRWVYRIPLVIGIYAVASGILTLAGWIFDVRRLMDWNNSGITMKANTAVCVVLLGLALIFTVRGVRYAVLMFAGAALAITLLTLSQYRVGQDEDRQQTRDAGFDAHLVKPVDPTVLLDLIAGQDAGANTSKEVL